MKKFLALVLSFILLLSLLASCSGKGETPVTKNSSSTVAAKDGKKTIAYITPDSRSPFPVKYSSAWKEECSKRDWEAVILDGAGDAAKQLSLIESLVAQKVDMICVTPIDSTAIGSGLKIAYDAGIPTMTVNADCDEAFHKYTIGYIGTPNFTFGYRSGECMAEALGNKPDKNIIICSLHDGFQASMDIVDGFKQAIKDKCGNVNYLDEQPGKSDKAISQALMEDWIVKYGDKIDAVFGADDTVAVGCINALKANNMLGKVIVVGAGGDGDGLPAIKNGEMYGTTYQSAAAEVSLVFENIELYFAGKPLQKEEEWKMELPIITKDNVDGYEPAY
jgi:ribose transport system substrate-binding protein